MVLDARCLGAPAAPSDALALPVALLPGVFGGRDLPAPYERAYDALERQYVVPNRRPLGVSLGMVAPTILRFGTPEVQHAYLRSLYRADLVGCQLFSEPGAGSDLAAVATRAERKGDAWLVNGQKTWSSGAHYSDIGLLLARSGTAPRYSNLTAFVIDMHAPGVEVRPLRQMTGGSEFNEVFLEDVVVPDSHRLAETGDGWRVALATLMLERSAVGGSRGGGTALLSTDRIRALLAVTDTRQDPVVRQSAARLLSELAIARWTRQRAEATRARGRDPGPEMSLAKLALTHNLLSLSKLVSAVLGPQLLADSGEWGTFAWNELITGVPGMRIAGGTDEIQKNIIAERVLKLPKH